MISRGLFFAGLLLALVVPGALIAQKEKLVRSGTPIILVLAPRDPRSLLQGDYMTLNYDISGLGWSQGSAWPKDGKLVLKADDKGVFRFLRLDDGTPLLPGEQRLRYRKRSASVRIGAEAFYFEEGHAADYQTARYGELRVTGEGDAVLVGLRGEKLEPLGAPRYQ